MWCHVHVLLLSHWRYNTAEAAAAPLLLLHVPFHACRSIATEACQTASWKSSSSNGPSRRRRPRRSTTRRGGSFSPRKKWPTMTTIPTKWFVPWESILSPAHVYLRSTHVRPEASPSDSFSIWQAEAKRSERISRPGEDQVRGDGPAGAKCAPGADVCIPGEDCGSFTRRSFPILRHQHRCSSLTFPFPMCRKTCISAALEEGERLTWDPMSMTAGQRKFAQVAQIDKVFRLSNKRGGKKTAQFTWKSTMWKLNRVKKWNRVPHSDRQGTWRLGVAFFFSHQLTQLTV